MRPRDLSGWDIQTESFAAQCRHHLCTATKRLIRGSAPVQTKRGGVVNQIIFFAFNHRSYMKSRERDENAEDRGRECRSVGEQLTQGGQVAY